MWIDGATRTTVEEMAALIAAGEILVARTSDRGIVGSVRLHDVAPDTSEFGILVAARDQRNLGIGRALLDEVERRSRERGLVAVQLELLVPARVEPPEQGVPRRRGTGGGATGWCARPRSTAPTRTSRPCWRRRATCRSTGRS